METNNAADDLQGVWVYKRERILSCCGHGGRLSHTRPCYIIAIVTGCFFKFTLVMWMWERWTWAQKPALKEAKDIRSPGSWLQGVTSHRMWVPGTKLWRVPRGLCPHSVTSFTVFPQLRSWLSFLDARPTRGKCLQSVYTSTMSYSFNLLLF